MCSYEIYKRYPLAEVAGVKRADQFKLAFYLIGGEYQYLDRCVDCDEKEIHCRGILRPLFKNLRLHLHRRSSEYASLR